MCVLNICSKHRGVHLLFLNKYTTCIYMKYKHMKMDSETGAPHLVHLYTRSAKLLTDFVDIAGCPGLRVEHERKQVLEAARKRRDWDIGQDSCASNRCLQEPCWEPVRSKDWEWVLGREVQGQRPRRRMWWGACFREREIPLPPTWFQRVGKVGESRSLGGERSHALHLGTASTLLALELSQ